MDTRIFMQMLKDKHFTDYKKMKYKYSGDFNEFLLLVGELYHKPLSLPDSCGNDIVYMEDVASINHSTVRLLLQPRGQQYGVRAAEEEIVATYAIESIDFNRDSVRRILKGLAPTDEQENRIAGIRRGIEFISDISNKITEENLYRLYMMTVGDFLSGDEKLKDGNFYRHDAVYVISDRIEHSGADCKKVPGLMKSLISFVNEEDGINYLIKAAIIHFYIAFVHPYFDGNGRMARLVHLWYLIQKGYQSALFIPFSSCIAKTRKAYYEAFTLIEENKKYSGKIDVTPFILYFTENVYNKMNEGVVSTDVLSVYSQAVKDGMITKKESQLWKFVLSYYGTDEFTTKQLEKDFGNAAYATIRSFVLKFEAAGLLSCIRYGARHRYKIRIQYDD